MAVDVVIPKLGMTMTDGTIVEWVVADGERVEVDQVLFVLSTDKLDTDVAAEMAGTLRHHATAGETHPCSTIVGQILGDGEGVPPAPEPIAPDGGSRVIASPYARRIARDGGLDLATLSGSGPGGRIVAADVLVATADRVDAPVSQRAAATPVARQLAEARGVDLALLNGTGPGGRITKEDVEAADAQGPSVAATAAVASASPAAAAESIPVRGMRKVIAERMHSSLHEMAQLTLGMEVDMTVAVELRRRLVEDWESEGLRVSVTDLVCRAAVKALADHPGLNATFDTDTIRVHPDVHLGLAVAVPDGLLVPVVVDASRQSLAGLSTELSRVAAACREGTIGIDEMEGATFTVTALGSAGIDYFTPVINPPNVAILGIGRVRPGVGWDGDRPIRREVMTLSLTIDHRAVDGAPGAAFLGAVRDLLQSPHRLLL